MRRWANVSLMLGQRRRPVNQRWPSVSCSLGWQKKAVKCGAVVGEDSVGVTASGVTAGQ